MWCLPTLGAWEQRMCDAGWAEEEDGLIAVGVGGGGVTMGVCGG